MCVLLCCFTGGYLPVSQPLTVLTLENSLKKYIMWSVLHAPIKEGAWEQGQETIAEEAQLPV